MGSGWSCWATQQPVSAAVFYHDAASVAADDNGVTIVAAGGKAVDA